MLEDLFCMGTAQMTQHIFMSVDYNAQVISAKDKKKPYIIIY